MLTFGGEIPFEPRAHQAFATGRFALRHLLQHLSHVERLAVPDYLCEVVLKEIRTSGIEAIPYSVKDDFSIELHEDLISRVDGIYVVHYFGFHTTLPCMPEHLVILHDGVFFPDPSTLLTALPNEQYAFNSWRKILASHEGAQLVSNVALPTIEQQTQSNFQLFKYRASELKTAYWRDTSVPLDDGNEVEQQFLTLYGKGEQRLDEELGVVPPSQEFYSNLPNLFMSELGRIGERWQRWQTAKRYLTHVIPESRLGFPCFFVFTSERLLELKRDLAQHNIFLPHFWPNQTESNMMLHREQLGFLPLSPVFSRALFDQALTIISDYDS